MLFQPRILFWILVAVIPAYFLNKFLLKVLRPKESFGRFFLYLLTCLAFAFAYTYSVMFVLLKIIGPPNK